MKLTLTSDDGEIFQTWTIPDEEARKLTLEGWHISSGVARIIERTLPVRDEDEED